MKPIRFRVVENVYRKHLTVLIDPDTERAKKALAKLTGNTPENSDPSGSAGSAILSYPKGNQPIIWLKSKNDLTTLAHECAHVAMYVLDLCGIKVTQENDEPFTYLMQFYMNRCLEQMGFERFTGPRE